MRMMQTRQLVFGAAWVLFSLMSSIPAATVNLAWQAPGNNNDGTVLSSVTGYKVYCGTTSKTYTRVIDTTAPQVTVYGLPDGQRSYFTVTALTAAQVEGATAPELVFDAPAAPVVTVEVLNRYYVDRDGDGHGSGWLRMAATMPAGYAATNDDCNDKNAALHPGAAELPNGLDDNCNGEIDEGLDAVGAVLDFDEDGVSDIGVYEAAAGRWWIAGSASGQDLVMNYGWADSVSAAADYNGDTVADYAFYWPGNGHWYITDRYVSGGVREVALGDAKAIPVPADYDGDGKADLAVYTPSRGEWAFTLSSGRLKSMLNLGGAAGCPVPDDYDGDGKADAAVYSSYSFTWTIIQSSNGARRVVPFGVAGAQPAQADYDGDGKTDPAYYHPGSGVWTLLASRTGYRWQWTLPTGGVPVPGDYNGDGWDDGAVFKPATGAWTLHFANGQEWTQVYGAGCQALGAQYQAMAQMSLARVK